MIKLARCFFVFLQYMVNQPREIAVGISGASGSIYAQQLLNVLCANEHIKVSIVLSKNAKDVWRTELGNDDYKNYKAQYFEPHDYMASFASGSSKTEALVIAPCSMGTLGRIAAGISDSLVTRAADVMLKERRKLILLTRETPLNLIHIKNMLAVTEAGATVCPASPSFYSKPADIIAAVQTVTNRVLGLLDISNQEQVWGK
jgi:flavin prenyltransferase